MFLGSLVSGGVSGGHLNPSVTVSLTLLLPGRLNPTPPAAGGAVCEWACLVAARGAARGGAVPGGGAGRGRRARAVLGRAEVAREPDRRIQVGVVCRA